MMLKQPSALLASLLLLSAVAGVQGRRHTDLASSPQQEAESVTMNSLPHNSLPNNLRVRTQAQRQRDLSTTFSNTSSDVVNCNHDAIAEWVQRHAEGGRCDDFANLVGGVELCQQYRNITDPAQCDELSTTAVVAAFTLGGDAASLGGDAASSATATAGATPREQCHYFASHLLPHSYFDDVDAILPVFGSSQKSPIRHNCSLAKSQDCIVAVHYLPEEERALPEGTTMAPTPAPFTDVVPCTQCDYDYEEDRICFEADCEVFNCDGDHEARQQQQPPPAEDVTTTVARSGPESIQVCFHNERSDLFSFVELRQGNFYGCSVQTEEKLWTTQFRKGVTNIQKVEFRLGVEEFKADIDHYGTDFCKLEVDGTACNSCTLCDTNDTALVEFDCSNIVTNATTSCHSETDSLYGISRKLLVLQEGFFHAATSSVAAVESGSSGQQGSTSGAAGAGDSTTPNGETIRGQQESGTNSAAANGNSSPNGDKTSSSSTPRRGMQLVVVAVLSTTASLMILGAL